ncbi:MAG: rRNA maturation RNase YbeY [Oligoflexia bacterium]|nr:rRNA maturation RNase YbeY [Oligoflexia bacterium]
MKAPKTAAIRKILKKVLSDSAFSKLPVSVKHLSVTFTDDASIRILNRNYRRKDKPTDVLSFPLLEGQAAELAPSLGDLVISLETTRAQAKRYQVTPSCELLRLMIHGLLHLAGYDHERVPPKEAQRMRRTERRILSDFNPPPSIL